MLKLFAMPFFFRALVVLIAAGAAFPVLGTFILTLELIPVRFAVMHAALLGAAAAMLLGVNPLVPALGASVLAGLSIAIINRRSRVSAGGSLGLIMTLCMALAFIIFYKANIRANEAFSLFWGSVLTLTRTDTIVTLIISAAILLFLAAAYREIHVVLYDRELARTLGTPASLVYGGIMLAVCLGIAAAMRVTGALLIDALTLLPALGARQIGKTFRGLILWGALLGIVMNLGGFALSFAADLPVSPGIILSGAGIILFMRVIGGLAQAGPRKNKPGGT
jgi:zinc transport system permease protein